MAEVENVFKPVLKKIAEEHEYNDYTTEVSLIDSGGANYTSQIYTATLSAPGKDDIRLFAKIAALTEEIRATFQVYKTESMFYTKLVPQYRKYEVQYKFPVEDRLFFSKFYGACNDFMKEVLVLEDLTAKGYQPFDRFECYDWEYASKCASYLAKLHALSVRYKRDYPEEFEDMSRKLAGNVSPDDIKFFIEKAISVALDMTADKKKESLARIIKDNMNDEKFKAFFDSPRKFVLSHGDFRPSNIMHKTNNDGSVDVVVLDYQTIRKGNPVSDLIYFLITGSDEEFRQKHMYQLFDHYYNEFNRMLRKLKINPYEVYTRNQFDEEVTQLLPFGIIVSLMILPIITVDVQDAPKVEDGINRDNLTVPPNARFLKRFEGLVRDFVNMKIL